MQYRKDRKGNDISLLGFGCMRFEGSGTGEYFQKANDQVMEAIRQGINYFDTAYVYKNNEKVLGRILAENTKPSNPTRALPSPIRTPAISSAPLSWS